MKPTIRDVAKKANVSVSTVSRVINQKGYVHKDTKDIVLSIIEELGYVPNQLARSLTNRSSKIIGVIVPHIGPTFYGELLEGIESQAATAGYKIMFCHTQDDPERELEYLVFFEQYNIEGLIIASNFSNTDKLEKLNIPIITVDHILNENIPSITSDNVNGGELGARELVARGRKNIIIFRGPSFLLTTVERTIGALNVFKKANMYVDIFDFDLLNPDVKLIEEILVNNPNVDGIFAFSDTLAIATMNILKKLKRSIPEDIYEGDNTKFPTTTLDIEVDVAELLGSETNIYMTLNESNICAVVDARAGIQIGDKMKMSFDPNKFHFFDVDTELRLRYEKGQPIDFAKQPHGIKRLKFKTETEEEVVE